MPGLFGRGDMYQNERLTWFQEGNAEFFAGSTRTNNVVPRRASLVDYHLILQVVIQQSVHYLLNTVLGISIITRSHCSLTYIRISLKHLIKFKI